MGFHVLACFRLFTAWEQKLRFSLLWISDSVQIIVRWPKYLGGQLPVNHQLQEVGLLFSHILLPLFCKWIRIWLVSLFTVYLSRAISKHLKSNIGTEPKPDSHARKNSLVGQPPLFPFLQPEYFLTLAKFLPPSKAKLKAKLLPLSKQNFLFPLSHSAWNSYNPPPPHVALRALSQKRSR